MHLSLIQKFFEFVNGDFRLLVKMVAVVQRGDLVGNRGVTLGEILAERVEGEDDDEVEQDHELVAVEYLGSSSEEFPETLAGNLMIFSLVEQI